VPTLKIGSRHLQNALAMIPKWGYDQGFRPSRPDGIKPSTYARAEQDDQLAALGVLAVVTG
jgi:hypothetical protein